MLFYPIVLGHLGPVVALLVHLGCCPVHLLCNGSVKVFCFSVFCEVCFVLVIVF